VRTLIILLIAALACACSVPREGEPCDESGQTCGEKNLGLECLDARWVAVCRVCEEDDDPDDRVIDICIAQDPKQCGAGEALPLCAAQGE
jgi:hypothetical protein